MSQNSPNSHNAPYIPAASEPLESGPPYLLYLERKRLLRQRLRRNFAALIAGTLLLGFLVFRLGFSSKRSGVENIGVGELALEQAHPTAAQLRQLVGEQLNEEQLAGHSATVFWGKSRVLAGSTQELELRYFPQAEVYLLHKRGKVVYAGKTSP